MKRSILKQTTSNTLGTNFVYTTTFALNWKLWEIFINFNEKYKKTITLKYKSSTHSNYSVELFSEKIKPGGNFIFVPTEPYLFTEGDELEITVESAASSTTAYITVIGEQI